MNPAKLLLVTPITVASHTHIQINDVGKPRPNTANPGSKIQSTHKVKNRDADNLTITSAIAVITVIAVIAVIASQQKEIARHSSNIAENHERKIRATSTANS